jgi:hypothetical protein
MVHRGNIMKLGVDDAPIAGIPGMVKAVRSIIVVIFSAFSIWAKKIVMRHPLRGWMVGQVRSGELSYP